MRDAGQQAFQRGSDRILGGVCSGMAAGFRVDPLWVRIAFVILAFFQGVGVFIYIVLWLVMPESSDGLGRGRAGFESMADDLKRVGADIAGQFRKSAPSDAGQAASPRSRNAVILGLILVVFGVLILAVNTGLVTWGVIWPVAVIAAGAALLVRALDRRP